MTDINIMNGITWDSRWLLGSWAPTDLVVLAPNSMYKILWWNCEVMKSLRSAGLGAPAPL